MTISPVTLSVYANSPTAQFTINDKLPVNQTSSTATNIGNLEEQSDTINISDGGSQAGVPVSTNFTMNQSGSLFFNPEFKNVVNQITTRVQITDSSGTIIADNQGSEAQQQAYVNLQSGLSVAAGTYTVTATPLDDGTPAAIALSATQNQGTSLNVNSQLTGADTSEYYNFSLGDGNNIKLAYDAGSNLSQTRVQLYNSDGQLVADSRGNSYLQNNFDQLTSGQGLSATSGNYQVVVSYASNVSTDQNINYKFQLYSGNQYSSVYTTNATATPSNNSATASVTATTDAQLYSRTAYHSIKETASSATNIGWIQENKTSIDVNSLITPFDKTDYYNFTLQTGNSLKFAFTNQTNTADLHVQIMDGTGNDVIADNEGTAAQQAAYKAITSSTGLAAKPGEYSVKVTYGGTAAPTAQQQYNFQIFSGTSYSTEYSTNVTAETYNTASLNGDIGNSYNAAAAAASYITSAANGSPTDIMSAIASSLA